MRLRVLSSLLLFFFLHPNFRHTSWPLKPLRMPEIQPAMPHLSLHLQLHREGYSLGGEASARLDSGATD